MHLTRPESLAPLLTLVLSVVEPLSSSHAVWKVQFDTYEREVERYGGKQGIQIAERVFHADSEAVADIVKLSATDLDVDSRWLLALFGVHALLSDMRFDLSQKLSLMSGLRAAHDKMFRVDLQLKRDIGRKFREHRCCVSVPEADFVSG